MGYDVEYVDPLDPLPKSKESVEILSPDERGPVARAATKNIGLPSQAFTPKTSSAKTKPSSVWRSPQECVGKHGKLAKKGVQWADRTLKNGTPLGGVNRPPLGEMNPRGRSWRDVVGTRNPEGANGGVL